METIGRTVEATFIHKKIFGGGGEFAKVTIRFEPLPPGSGIQFMSDMPGPNVPEHMIGGVEEGVRQAAKTGILEGGPVVDFKATLIDGAYHEIDSNWQAFSLAAQGAFRIGVEKAGSKILGSRHDTAKNVEVQRGQSRRVDVELFIVHPTISPAEISTELGLEPHFAHRVGDPRKTPKGTLLGGQNPDTRWRYCIRYELEDQWFAYKIAELVETLMPHKAFFRLVRASGGTSQIIIQFLGDGYFGDKVSEHMLGKLAELQLDFGIECFTVPQN